MDNDEIVLESLQQATDWGILTTDAELRVTGWNHWLEDNSARKLHDVSGRNLLELFPELASRGFERFYRQALAGHAAVLSQRLHSHLLEMPSSVEGSRFETMQQSVRIAPLSNEGRVVGTLTIIEDVTERVVFEEELAVRARQQAVVAMLGEHALAGDDTTALLEEAVPLVAEMLKSRFCGIFEALPDDAGMTLRAGWGWNPRDVGRAKIDASAGSLGHRLLTATDPIVFSDITSNAECDRPDLFQRYGIASGACVAINGGGRFIGALGAFADKEWTAHQDDVHFLEAIANVLGSALERKRLEEALNARVDQLAGADRRKDEFLAMLAHELRNPLAPIQNAIQILRMTGPTEPELGWARDVIERQVEQMTRMVDDLLDVSRFTRGKINLQLEPVDLARIVERALEISRPGIEAHRHTLTVSLPNDALWVNADSTRLAQVVANVLNNAAKYSPDGGQIGLTAAQEGDEIVVRIRDSGVGIAPHLLSQVFDLFTQVDRSLDRSEGGLGIGLTLVRNLVELHGGSVAAHSEGAGKGSEFVIRLPICSPPEKAPLSNSDLETAAPLQSRKILVVDDNVDCAKTLAMLLKKSGNSVRMAGSGPAALDLAADDPPEIVFLDIGLPGMNGYEVARRLRQGAGHKPLLVVALSGYGQSGDQRQSEVAGFDHHLVKPVSLGTLQRLLREWQDSEIAPTADEAVSSG